MIFRRNYKPDLNRNTGGDAAYTTQVPILEMGIGSLLPIVFPHRLGLSAHPHAAHAVHGSDLDGHSRAAGDAGCSHIIPHLGTLQVGKNFTAFNPVPLVIPD